MKTPIGLSLITREVDKNPIEQRVMDGYINATDLCKAAGKRLNDYTRLQSTQSFIEELASVTGISVTALIQSITGAVFQPITMAQKESEWINFLPLKINNSLSFY